MKKHGFIRITAASCEVRVGNPEFNATGIIRVIQTKMDSDIILFQELGVTGYTCANLFSQQALLDASNKAVDRIRVATSYNNNKPLIVIGAPLAIQNSLYNCAIVMSHGQILGIVPKQYLPNYREFYELRWFRAANGNEPISFECSPFGINTHAPFGTDLLFDNDVPGCRIGVEICEDLWMPVPPSSYMSLAGATVLLNLSASNETIGKSNYRRDLVVGQSGRCMAAYAYASSGPSESSTDVVFGGHCLIAENGTLLVESKRVGDGSVISLSDSYSITADVDLQRLMADRRVTTSFDDSPIPPPSYRIQHYSPGRIYNQDTQLLRYVSGRPFVPKDNAELHVRCAEIFGVQVAGLAKRLSTLPADTPLSIGISVV